MIINAFCAIETIPVIIPHTFFGDDPLWFSALQLWSVNY